MGVSVKLADKGLYGCIRVVGVRQRRDCFSVLVARSGDTPKPVPCNIEQHFFREARITGYRLKKLHSSMESFLSFILFNTEKVYQSLKLKGITLVF